ncbi:DUF115 domain-containing protein [Treponema sp.]
MTDEEPRKLQARRGLSLSFKGKTLLSRIDPIAQAEKIVNSAPLRKKALYFCPSPLYGYGLGLLLSRIPEDSDILCVECDEKLMKLSSESLAPLLSSPRIRLVRSTDPASVCAYVRKWWGARRFRRLEVLRLNSGWSLAEQSYDAIADALSADIAMDWSNAITLIKLGRLYALNAIRNLALLPLAEDIRCMNVGTRPILVVGAGPSMDATLDAIGAIQGAAQNIQSFPFKIFCVDTALRALLDRNIKPDLVIALETQQWNLNDFIGVSSAVIPVAMDLSSLPATAQAGGGSFSFFFTPWAPLQFLDRLEEERLVPQAYTPLGSVGLSTVALALRSTSGPVYITGLDFSYTPDAYHARSTPSRLDRLRSCTRLQPLIDPSPAFRPRVVREKGKEGFWVWTDPALKSYRDLFKREFEKSGRVFDIGCQGLELGIQRWPVERLWDTYEDTRAQEPAIPAPREQHWGFDQVLRFLQAEQKRLSFLRDSLSGKLELDEARVEKLIDECDYLWAHFPECAGAEGQRPILSDSSFLKRIRAEIEPFSKALKRAEEELSRRSS